MPLRLKSLELHGYKTFASRIRFEFSGKITAIVGPNGSGKSNIADALRWALGEQSYSILRGKRTEDMIFAGSENRPRAGMASVSLNFDNSDNWLPIEFSEVDVTRRAYRDGRNDYLVNSQHVRLKDINELFSQSGLSQRTYTILGQGLVDASLALKADERRKLFEEAAGIGLFQTRRNEALRRLDITNRNLDRVLDILAELRPRLKSLEKQSKKAQQYQQVQEGLKATLKEWYGYHWKKSQKEMNEARSIVDNHSEKLKEARKTYQSVRNEYSNYRDKLHNLRSNLNSWHKESSGYHSQREIVSRETAVLDERRKSLEDNRKNVLLEVGRLEAEIETIQSRYDKLCENTDEYQVLYDDSQNHLENAQKGLNVSKQKRSSIEEKLIIAKEQNTKTRNELFLLKAQEQELLVRIERIERELDSTNKILSIIDEKGKELSQDYSNFSKARKNLEEQQAVIQNSIEILKSKVQSYEENKKRIKKELDELTSDSAKLYSQEKVLTDSESAFMGYADGARFLLESSRQKKFNGEISSLSSVLEVPQELEHAITAALGSFLDSLIIQSDKDFDEAMKLLQSEGKGRATLLQIKKLILDQQPEIGENVGVVGLASNLVSISPEFKPVAEYFLNRILIVTDRNVAMDVLQKLPKDIKVITLNAEVFFASGPIQVGRSNDAGLLSRRRTIEEIKQQISVISAKKEELEKSKETVDNKINEIKNEIIEIEIKLSEIIENYDEKRNSELFVSGKFEANTHKKELHLAQTNKYNSELIYAKGTLEDIARKCKNLELTIQNTDMVIAEQKDILSQILTDELTSNVTYWSAEVTVAKHSFDDSTQRKEELLNQLSNLKIQMNNLCNRLSEYEKSMVEIDKKKEDLRKQETDISNRLEKIRSMIEPAENELDNAVLQESRLQEQETKNQLILANVERFNNQIQLDYERKHEAVENLRQKIEDDFGLISLEYDANVDGPVPLPFEGLVEQLETVDVLPPDLEETLSRQRMLLRQIGPVNPDANEEYESVAERHIFLETQLEDLKKAVVDIETVIDELDEITRQEFFKTYTAVAEEFKAIFHRLFGGGSARLLLTDPDNLIDSGIDIEAQLPGRREQGLALLSGGERSLTAIALIFSLLRVSPTPVCVMDEVDAMLDEANVGRFRDLLQELSEETQFIIITHNRNTVQAADIIYGVTMGSDSVSQIISLKLDEISDEILLGR